MFGYKWVGFNAESTPSIHILTVKKMKQKELSELTDQELLDEAKKMIAEELKKSTSDQVKNKIGDLLKKWYWDSK